MKKFLGGAVRNVRKTTDAAVSALAAEVARKRAPNKEPLPPSRPPEKGAEKLGRLSTVIKAGNEEKVGWENELSSNVHNHVVTCSILLS